jgi:hypothetical protein
MLIVKATENSKGDVEFKSRKQWTVQKRTHYINHDTVILKDIMPEESNVNEWKSFLWAIRIYALIIIAVLVISDLTSWLAADTVKLIIMLMALFTITSSFQLYLAEHKNARKWIMAGIVVLLVLGMLVFLLTILK